MTKRKKFTLKRIAAAYGMTHCNVFSYLRRYGWPREIFRKPDEIFSRLLANHPASALRQRLADPAERSRIAAMLENLI